ncbi:bifunctional acetate--CoA ligase family protein/GNAT family N-acetyltransferase [Kocuria sp.]|uniref:bifunctional acetate--CoA ligase family protein/GNAT family N-acetyltransferase n=1 Tax=Kocuria sp. TaxID=1871328 RepID=UPI0026DFF1E4|nr:GNAT family N-acetyltransferase [Kocuria sp.]MDO5619371.1 GNAT family N-acetyltransferase [Kocuria sp.]
MVSESSNQGGDTHARTPGGTAGPDTAAIALQQGYPAHWEADVVLRDGATANLRPVTPDDQDALLEMFHGQSENTIYLRFFSHKTTLTKRELERYTTVDHRDRVAFVIMLGGSMIGIGRYDRTQKPNDAEVAFLISDAHQGRGIGSILLEHLSAAALENGIDHFSAEVLPENRAMLRVFVEAGYDVARHFDDGVVALEFSIDPTEKQRSVMVAREHRAEARSTARILTPSSIAVVGASADPSNGGHVVVNNIVASGFSGALYGINPVEFAQEGMIHKASVADIGEPVDLAVVAVPYDAVLEVVDQCGRAGAHAVVVVTGGWAEAGAEGALRQRQLVRLARGYGMRVVGPASLGVLNNAAEHRFNATVLPAALRHGTVGLFTQSGALGTLQASAAVRHAVGISTFVSAGNRADVSGNDMMQFWEDDSATKVCGMTLQSFGNPRKYSRIARRLSRIKPVIVAKSEVTGLRLPPGHTGRTTEAPAGALNAMLQQAGVLQVATSDQLMDLAAVASAQPWPRGVRTALLANAMALGRLMEDTAAILGMPVTAVRDNLDTSLGGGRALENVRTALAGLLADADVDAVVVSLIPAPGVSEQDWANAVAQAGRNGGKPVVLAMTGSTEVRAPSHVHRHGDLELPVFLAPSSAVEALHRIQEWVAWRDRESDAVTVPEDINAEAAEQLLAEWSAEIPGESLLTLDAERTRQLLATYGISVLPTVRFRDVEQAVAAAEELGYPVAVKSTDRHLRHRLDLGGVRLQIDSAEQLRDAITSMRRTLPVGSDQLDLQAMAPTGQAVVVTATEDPLVGPVLSFGIAGDAVKLLDDRAHRVPPLTDQDIHDMVREPKAARKLFGYEGQPPVAVEALEDLMIRVALLKDRHPYIARLDLNPVLLSSEHLTVLSADVRLGDPKERTDSARRAMRR